MHLRLEAKVDHPVSLVHDDVVALVQHCVALLQAVDQAPGRRDDDLAPLSKLEALILDALTCALVRSTDVRKELLRNHPATPQTALEQHNNNQSPTYTNARGSCQTELYLKLALSRA